MTPRVLLAIEATMQEHATLVGSALDGKVEVIRLRWPEWLPGRVTADRYVRTGARPSLGPAEDAYVRDFDAALAIADALLVSPWSWVCVPEFTSRRWALASRLKVVAGTFDHRFHGILRVAEAARRSVAVVDTSRSMTPSVAEFALAMILNLLRDIPASAAAVRAGGWKADLDLSPYVNGELTGRRVGLAGFGSINRRLAELLEPFGCSVSAYDPYAAMSDNVRATRSLLELAAGSEVLVVGIPPTPATRAVIDAAVLAALPPGALLVLVTRMHVMDQAALRTRVLAGKIRAAVDVFDPEPPAPADPLRTSPHVLPTPHMAGDTLLGHRRCFLAACADTLAVLAGSAPRYPASVHDDWVYRGAPAG